MFKSLFHNISFHVLVHMYEQVSGEIKKKGMNGERETERKTERNRVIEMNITIVKVNQLHTTFVVLSNLSKFTLFSHRAKEMCLPMNPWHCSFQSVKQKQVSIV